MGAILLVVLLLLLLGVVPAWPHSRKWGYYPGGAVMVLFVIVLLLVLLGPVPFWFGPPSTPVAP